MTTKHLVLKTKLQDALAGQGLALLDRGPCDRQELLKFLALNGMSTDPKDISWRNRIEIIFDGTEPSNGFKATQGRPGPCRLGMDHRGSGRIRFVIQEIPIAERS